jgi:8-hydroxy-5-deazaflavin:NADPH oxidoreductase
MKIGIIGAGAIGSTLARDLVKLGHTVSVANSRGPESLAKIAAATGATAVGIADVVRGVQLVVVSIPECAIAKLPQNLFAGADENVVVIDTGNYYPDLRDGRIPALDAGAIESQWVSEQLGRPVVKAFNNIGAASLRDKGVAASTPGRLALPVAGDRAESKAIVMDLVDRLGFDAINGGSLGESWRQQPGTPSYCHDLDAHAMKRALADARPEHLAQYREESLARAKALIAARAKA